MKIAIIGYGKMGREVEKAAKNAGHEVVAIVDPKSEEATTKEISTEALNGAEIAIEFTHPDVLIDNVRKLAEAKVDIVTGTTGWYDKLPEVEKIVNEADVGLLYAGNFSVGVNTFYAIVAEAAKRLNKAGGFDVAIHETHHTGKADAPSGTARELGNVVLENFPSKKRILLDNAEQPVPPEALQISSNRLGKVIGVHTVTFDGASDTITLSHSGKNREGYATGSIKGAEWLQGKKGVFSVKEWFAS